MSRPVYSASPAGDHHSWGIWPSSREAARGHAPAAQGIAQTRSRAEAAARHHARRLFGAEPTEIMRRFARALEAPAPRSQAWRLPTWPRERRA